MLKLLVVPLWLEELREELNQTHEDLVDGNDVLCGAISDQDLIVLRDCAKAGSFGRVARLTVSKGLSESLVSPMQNYNVSSVPLFNGTDSPFTNSAALDDAVKFEITRNSYSSDVLYLNLTTRVDGRGLSGKELHDAIGKLLYDEYRNVAYLRKYGFL